MVYTSICSDLFHVSSYRSFTFHAKCISKVFVIFFTYFVSYVTILSEIFSPLPLLGVIISAEGEKSFFIFNYYWIQSLTKTVLILMSFY